jgi:putative oxidoreductase
MTATAATADRPAPPRALHVTLWVAQSLLALSFHMGGLKKATTPLAELAVKMTWVNAIPGPLVRFIAVSEILGALGVILPSLTRIQPRLTALAGAGLATIMVLAAALHASRGEFPMIAINAVLFSLAAFVAWGRFKRAPIAAR